MSAKKFLILFLLLLSLSACTVSIPDPSELPDIVPSATPSPSVLLGQSPSSEPSESVAFTGDPLQPSATPHDNYLQRWEDVYGIPQDVPQLAYGVSKIAYLNEGAIELHWSIINDADIEGVCGVVEEWAGREMKYSEGSDKSGNPTRIWENDTETYFIRFTVSQRDEPSTIDGSVLQGDMMISKLQ